MYFFNLFYRQKQCIFKIYFTGKNKAIYYSFIYNLMMVLENDPIVVDYSNVMQRQSYLSFGK
jgi:hypothetical protein